jgi:hypothetical protein
MHVHVWAKNDKVAGGLSLLTDRGCNSDDCYNNNITQNIEFIGNAETLGHSIQQEISGLNRLYNKLKDVNPFVDIKYYHPNPCQVTIKDTKSTTTIVTPKVTSSQTNSTLPVISSGVNTANPTDKSTASDNNIAGEQQTIPYTAPTLLVSTSGETRQAEAGYYFKGILNKDGKIETGKLYNAEGKVVYIFYIKK